MVKEFMPRFEVKIFNVLQELLFLSLSVVEGQPSVNLKNPHTALRLSYKRALFI